MRTCPWQFHWFLLIVRACTLDVMCHFVCSFGAVLGPASNFGAVSLWLLSPRRPFTRVALLFLSFAARRIRQLDEHLRAALGAAGLGAGSGRRGDAAVPFSSPLHWAPFKVFSERAGFRCQRRARLCAWGSSRIVQRGVVSDLHRESPCRAHLCRFDCVSRRRVPHSGHGRMRARRGPRPRVRGHRAQGPGDVPGPVRGRRRSR